MGPSEGPSTGWTHKEAEMQIDPQPDEKSRGWRLGHRSIAPPSFPPALSFLLLLLPLASALQPTLLAFPELRLVGGPSRCRGRLEVLHGGSWGSVCDDDWDVVDANVVCRQLGCGLALPVPRPLAFGQGRGPILLDNVECRGQETALSECGSRGWGIHNCFHYEDVAVLCDEFLPTQPPTRKVLTTRAPPTTHQNGKGEGSVRLVGGTGPCQGRVEILHGGLWGTVCDDDWGLPDAAVVCRQLGCGSAVAATTNAFFGYGTGHILLDNVHCEGSETRLAACLSLGWGVHNCGHHEDAGAFCAVLGPPTLTALPPSATREDWAWHTGATGIGALTSRETALFTTVAWAVGKKSGRVRLVGGPSPCRGRVEVLYAGGWGTVCDDDWDFADARVACREAGCGPALGATGLGHFGYGRGPVLLDNVGCAGTEARLSDCFHLGWGQHNCGHHEDAGALCSGTRSDLRAGRRELGAAPGRGRGRPRGLAAALQRRSPTARALCGCAAWAGLGALGRDEAWGGAEGRCALRQSGRPEELGLQVQQDGSETTRVPTPRPRDGHLRLANGAHRCEGRVELFLGQQWGTVCDDAWDLRAAGVLCHQLGCGQALAAPGEAHFGPGRGPILLDNVKCRGDESALLLCSHIRWDAHNCDHSEDASVLCRPS
ncbi:Scavenger receptor cysteine-rich domain-containing group B protein [Galemys pyrenaicus]|uniref:Scavenger receptor cysteine-rich domain-containing group B protein n=1 Tax=Galemys pyrenaicus TaxID=202257 RepID=A0A8J6DKT3_GALPY|nr:Scavenger receptor cysteine-rich domain-containing group B protein [Galemys pyrenaicus]